MALSPTRLFDAGPPAFLVNLLRDVYDPVSRTPRELANTVRPHVTLTFAQSLDAKIAGVGGKQLILSGSESLVMTHWMRTMHDAILVGIGTALNDDPQLNTRHVPTPPGSFYRPHCPRPIVLDTNLRLPLQCKLLKNYQGGAGRRPWVICSLPAPAELNEEMLTAWFARREALRDAGAHIIVVPGEHGHISIPALLTSLLGLGISSLMVEGGAEVIKSFLSAASKHPSAVDAVIVTVAPTLVGSNGVGYGSELLSGALPTLKHVHTELFGRDAVMAMECSGREQ